VESIGVFARERKRRGISLSSDSTLDTSNGRINRFSGVENLVS
jgi:hypothetical protein